MPCLKEARLGQNETLYWGWRFHHILFMVKLSEVRVCLAVVNVPGSPVVLVIGGHVFRHVTRLGARVWRVAAENARDTRRPKHRTWKYVSFKAIFSINYQSNTFFGEILTKICLHTYFYIWCLFVFVRLAQIICTTSLFFVSVRCAPGWVKSIYLLVMS